MSSSDSEVDIVSHKASLKKLRTKDPEFYSFLQENDKKLLEFGEQEDEDEAMEDKSDVCSEEEGMETKNLSSEDTKVEANIQSKKNIERDRQNITLTQITKWKQQIQNKPTVLVCKNIIMAFKAVVNQAGGEDSQVESIAADDTCFNEIIRLCIVELVPALCKVLKLPVLKPDGKMVDPSISKMWKKMLTSIKSYLSDVLKILSIISEASILTLILKHVIHLIPFYSKFVKLSRLLLKQLVLLWCTSEETVRVLALLNIVRITKALPKEYLDYILKQMYLSYVKNSKFTSTSTWPLINFMKRSLVEVYSLDHAVAYEHAFVYIRQLSIHLRNAITVKKKDAYQAVYNWQYVHCILLWTQLLCELNKSEVLKSLIFPLVQTTIGTINLIPTAKYFPLRFHLLRALIQLSKDADVFIPILPMILETLKLLDFSKKPSFSKKPLNFLCMLKVSKSQLQEVAFKDSVITQVYELLFEYFNIYSHTIGFPELALPTVLQLKNFLKKCKIPNYCRQMKQVLDKVQENSNMITERRKSVNFKISECEKIDLWEKNCLQQGTPLGKYYELQKKLENKVKPLGKKRKRSKHARKVQ